MYTISRKSLIIFLAISFSFFIAFVQPFGYSPDYTQYEKFFQQSRRGLELDNSRFEPGFIFIAAILTYVIKSDVLVYSILAILSIFLKLYFSTIDKTSKVTFLIVLFYFFKFLPLHELTQLRVSLSAGFVVGAFYYNNIKNNPKTLILCCIAILFHYSSMMIIPFIFISPKDRKKILVLSLAVTGFTVLISPFIYSAAGNSLDVFSMYNNADLRSKALNPFSPVFFPELLVIFVSLFFWSDLTDNMKRVIAFEIFGFAIFYATIKYDVVAVRGREFFSVLWIFYISDFKSTSRRVRILIYFFIFFTLLISFYIFFIGNFFTPIANWTEND